MNAPDIITPRLTLKSTREIDGDFCLSLWLDPLVGKYMSDPPRELADEAELTFAVGIETEPGWYPFVAWEQGEAIGTCSAVPMNEAETEWDLGYALRQDKWRQGYGTEMVRALMAFALERGAEVITATAAQENAGSCGLLQSLGFTVLEETSFRKRLTEIVYPACKFIWTKA